MNDVEDIVKKHSVAGYAQPQVVPVPDEFEPELPRMIFSSKGGHSQILISQTSITFNANYSPDWASDPDKCREYLLNKVPMLFEIASAGWKDSPLPAFTGVTTALFVNTDTAAEAVRLIAPAFCDSERLVNQASELSYRWSLNVDSKFYSNISVASATRLRMGALTSADRFPRFNEKSIEGYGIEIAGDFNDRLAYNSNIELASDEANARFLIESGFDMTLDYAKSLSGSAICKA